jgi:hypothetical protein
MKRYLLFADSEKYDYGRGWETFISSYGNVGTAMREVNRHAYSWYQIIDTHTMQTVKAG